MAGVKYFNPVRDIPSLAGKVIFITGATAGLGSLSVKALAKHNPAHIYLDGRNVKRGEAVIAETKKTNPKTALTFVQCDLSSLESTKASIQNFKHDRLDILICSAGIMVQSPELSKDGYEIQFATNHLGHASLINSVQRVEFKFLD